MFKIFSSIKNIFNKYGFAMNIFNKYGFAMNIFNNDSFKKKLECSNVTEEYCKYYCPKREACELEQKRKLK